MSSELSKLKGAVPAFRGVFMGSRRLKDRPHSNLETESEESKRNSLFKRAASESLCLPKNPNGRILDVGRALGWRILPLFTQPCPSEPAKATA